MPALVRALNNVDLPTLGRPTMPHFKLMKISLENNPLCTIEPNVDNVDVPDPRRAGPDSKSYEPGTDTSVFRGICPRFA
jgi:ribosome-binding ATPase YchF (GTP1/OBG family)